MRTCFYASGNTAQVPTGTLCPDPFFWPDGNGNPSGEGDPLVDWSDGVDVFAGLVDMAPLYLLGAFLLFSSWSARKS